MKLFLLKCVFLLSVVFPLFSQSVDREQGLVTSDPFWRQALGGSVLSLPSVQAQSAVVALDGGNIRAYSTAGTPMWSYSAKGKISPYVTRSREGTSYLSRTNGTFIAVNRAGRELWRRSLDDPLCARVITGWDGRLFVPTEKKMYCFTASGTLLWTKTLEKPVSIAPKLDRNGNILLAIGKDVYRIDPFGNEQIWTLAENPAVILPIDQKRILALYADGTMEEIGASQDWFLSAQSGVQPLILPRLPANPLAAVYKDNNIAVTMNDGRVTLLSINERKFIWTGDSHMREMAKNGNKPEQEVEMLFDERGIYVLSKNGASCFSAEGRRFWFTYVKNAASVPAFGNDGVLYSGGRDWILYAYKIEDRVLPEKNALFGPLPEGSYGMGRPHTFNILEIPLTEQEKKAKLEKITKAVNEGKVGSDEPEWTSFLLNVSAGIDEPIQFRIAAMNLLGKIGSYETIPWLINIFQREIEPVLKSTAIKAVGDIGIDSNGMAIQTFLHTIIQNNIKNDQVLTAIAAATGALCRFSGPPLSETGIKILNLLVASSQPPATRRQASKELESMR
jgi:outer membrane protein assembly factor BamB